MTELSCIIIDDDPLSRDLLRNCVSKTPNLRLLGSYPNAIEGKVALDKKDVDLIFLDVEMPEMSGLEFLETFRNVPQVIIVTSEKKYAFEAFKYDVTDFLAKPVDIKRFGQAVDRARFYEDNLFRQKEDDHIFIKSDNSLVKLRSVEIEYVEAMGDYVKVVTANKNYVVHSTMKAFMAKLPEDDFLRVHKSYILNLKKVEEVVEGYAIGEYFNLPVSRSNRKILLSKIS
ncbi:MAG: LytR/AlgR family response regulator transcription factor [Owenweeksia sp.]